MTETKTQEETRLSIPVKSYIQGKEFYDARTREKRKLFLNLHYMSMESITSPLPFHRTMN